MGDGDKELSEGAAPNLFIVRCQISKQCWHIIGLSIRMLKRVPLDLVQTFSH
jgi:hypothetical protein